MALVLDTGPLYASLDRDDADHEASRRLIVDAREPLIIPAPVLVEVDYWIHRRLYPAIVTALLNDILADVFLVEALTSTDYQRVRDVCDQYADADIGFVDAAV